MKEIEHRSSILQPLLILIGAILLIWYVINALNTGNWIWFLPVQPDYTPSRILVRDDGRSVEYTPGVDGFVSLAEALNTSFSGFANTDLIPIGLSDETLRQYSETGVVMEVYYPNDIRFNTPVRMRNINQLLIPVEGRHAGNHYVFLGADGRWITGAMVMDDDTAIMDALRSLGHLDEETR